MDYSLDIEELKQIPFDKYEKDFSFFVNGKEFKTNRFLADFLSPIIRNYHYHDSTTNTFSINVEDVDTDKNDFKDQPLETYFDEFLQLCTFSKNQIDETHQKYFSAYFYAIGNIKEYFRIQTKNFEEIEVESIVDKIKVISNIKFKFFNNNMSSDQYIKIIEFAAENFEKIDKNELKKLKKQDIEDIIKNDHLRIDSEDSLMEFILNLYEKDQSNAGLFEYVIFGNLSKEMIDKFISVFDIDYLNNNTWKSICVRLSQTPKIDKSNTNRYNISITKFEIDTNNKFNGILKYLSNKTNGNIAENGTISITIKPEKPNITRIVDYNSTDYFQYIDSSMGIISFDFKKRSVKLTNYSIQTGTWSQNDGHLKNWAIESSNDGEKWEEIDSRSNNSSLNGKRNSSTFDIEHKQQEFYRFVRLRQTGLSWCPNSNNQFEITYIDFYGFLKEPI